MQPETNLTKDYSLDRFKNSFNIKDKTNNGKAFDQIKKIKVLQLRDQLDFYFGDSNLAKDKFLIKKL